MKFLHILPLIFLIALFLFCVDNFNNPTDSQYDGDYAFSVTWDSLSGKTLQIFRPYSVPFMETGEDDFDRFTLVDGNGNVLVYTSLLNNRIKTDTVIQVYFIRPVSGFVYLKGIRPNHKEVTDSASIQVINPFIAAIDTLLGLNDTLKGTISLLSDTFFVVDGLQAQWTLPDTAILMPWNMPLRYYAQELNNKLLYAGIRDTSGNSLILDTATLTVAGYSPHIDSVSISNKTLGDTLLFDIWTSDADSSDFRVEIWAGDSVLYNKSELYNYAPTISLKAQEPVTDTGAVVFSLKLTDENGLSSSLYRFTDTVSYTLSHPVFSDSVKTVPAGKTVMLSFNDENNSPGTAYRWFSSSLSLDTITFSDSLSVLYSDTVTDTVSVFGTDAFGYSGDTARVIVIPRYFNYTLEKISWPENLQARHWNIFSVAITPQAAADYFWEVSPAGLVDSAVQSNDTLRLYVHDSIPPVTISVFAVESGGDTTNLVSELTPTVLNRPLCLFSEAVYEAEVGETVRCSLEVSDANGSIAGVYLRFNGGDTIALGTETFFDSTFSFPGAWTVYCWAEDDDAFISEKDSASVVITSDKPYFDPLNDDTTVFINDSVRLSVTAYPGNSGAVISGYFWDTDGDGIYDDTTDTNFTILQFASAGNKTVYTGCINSFGDTAVERFTWHITVNPGTPQISSVGVENDSVYINDSITFTIHAYDNGAIVKYEYSLDSASFTDLGQDSVYSLTFADSGTHAVYTRVTDDESNLSAVHKTSMYINYGAPVLDSVSLDTVWVNDENSYTFYFHDVNDSVESITVNFGDGSGDSTVSGLSGTSVSIAHAYPVTKDTGYTINASVTDNDGIAASKDFAVFVFSGAPVFDSLTPDTVWVRDNNDFTVFARDTNGTLDSFRVSFNNGTTWIGSAVCTISHAFDTGDAGLKDVFVQAMDDDGQWAKDTVQVTVRLGRPVLRGDSDDTTWVIIDKQPGQEFVLHINCYDTNGVFTRFYWQETSPFDTTSGSCVKTDDSTRVRLIGALEVNNGWQSWIYCKDDDGLLGGKQFIVYADSIPPAPTVTDQVSHPNVMISWSGMDAKDSAETQYKILCDKNNPPQAVISDFKSGKEYEDGGAFDFSFTFEPNQGSGVYYYQVIAKDARNSQNISSVALFNY